MRYVIPFLLVATLFGIMNACGPSEEELERRRQARQDSIEQARQDSIQEARQDSIEQARQDSLEAQRLREQRRRERNRIEFDSTGNFTVQVESWRSKEKAQEMAEKWKERDYENAFVVQYGNPETGNVWFRVRLGRVATLKMAKKLGAKVQRQHSAEYWITNIENQETTPEDPVMGD